MRARDVGWEALVVTIDAAPGCGREHNERNGYSFPFRPNVTAAVDMAMHPGWIWRVMRKYLTTEGMPAQLRSSCPVLIKPTDSSSVEKGGLMRTCHRG